LRCEEQGRRSRDTHAHVYAPQPLEASVFQLQPAASLVTVGFGWTKITAARRWGSSSRTSDEEQLPVPDRVPRHLLGTTPAPSGPRCRR
jgi:hypothetical protein